MNEKEKWIKSNVSVEDFGVDVSITCGHGRQEYFLTLRQQNPRVAYICCPGCYYMITGKIIKDVFTVRIR